MRESWKSRTGLILAAAGNAVGIGNLLRFPGQAASNGGGAFIIPYLVCLVIFGIPMMWIAWTIGRYGARFGHGTTPGIFQRMTKWPGGKYLGALGVALPLVFCLYYTYLEAWCLAYAWFSFRGTYETANLRTFLAEFQGVASSDNYFPSANTALVFLLITLLLNVWVLFRGVARGIELLAKIAMPMLLLFCVLMVVRIFTLPDAKGSVLDGLAFVWNPKFDQLTNPSVWLAAAGQIFFTLSIGFGSLEAYASYLKKNDDVAVTGLTTATTNEFVEIIFGSMIAIPAAAVFFGAARIPEIAGSGTFDIGMVSMPEILRATHSTTIFGSIWFLLLFFAAFTSSVAVCQPVVAFFQDEAKLSRGAAAALVGLFWLLGTIPVVYFLRYGFLDELDFWAGTLGLVLFSAIEAVLFSWVFGIGRGWKELHRGALMQVPPVFRFIMRYVTPVALMAILAGWFYNDVLVGGKLTPQPTLSLAVMNQASHKGDISRSKPDAKSDDGKRYAELQHTLFTEIERTSHDLKVWATVRFDAAGLAHVEKLEGDPNFISAMPAGDLQQFLRLSKTRYLENNAPAPATVTYVIEGLYTKPYIWLARLLIVGVIALFVALVAVIWKKREEDGEDTGPQPDTDDDDRDLMEPPAETVKSARKLAEEEEGAEA